VRYLRGRARLGDSGPAAGPAAPGALLERDRAGQHLVVAEPDTRHAAGTQQRPYAVAAGDEAPGRSGARAGGQRGTRVGGEVRRPPDGRLVRPGPPPYGRTVGRARRLVVSHGPMVGASGPGPAHPGRAVLPGGASGGGPGGLAAPAGPAAPAGRRPRRPGGPGGPAAP